MTEVSTEDSEVLTAAEVACLQSGSAETGLIVAREGILPGEEVGRDCWLLRADYLDYVRVCSRGRSKIGAL